MKMVIFHPIKPIEVREIRPHLTELPDPRKTPLDTYAYTDSRWFRVITGYTPTKGHHWHEVPLKFVPKHMRAMLLIMEIP
jgi:hypothetical protein